MKLRKWTTEDKITIVLEGLKGQKSVAEICQEQKISQTLFYRWHDRFLGGGQKNLMNRSISGEADAFRAEIINLQKNIDRQTNTNKALKKQGTNLREVVNLIREKGDGLKASFETLGMNRISHYRITLEWKKSVKTFEVHHIL